MSADPARKAYKYSCNMIRPQIYSEKSLMESVVDFFSDVVPQAYTGTQKNEDREKIQWVRFENCDCNDVAKNPDMFRSDTKGVPLLLILGYSNGVHIWHIMPNGEAHEILSIRQGPVRICRILPSPEPVLGNNDGYSNKRPLAVMCDSSSAGQPYCAVKFVSLKTGDEVHNISFKTLPVQNIECNKRFIVIVFLEKVCIHEVCQFQQLFWITSCFPCSGPSVNPIALSTRWLAYADKRLVAMHQSCGGMSGDGSQSYAATVISAAKGAFKGLSMFGEAMVSSVTGSKPVPVKRDYLQLDNGNRPGIVTVVDIQNIHNDHFNVNEDNEGDGLIAHFHAHANEPVANMAFDPTGTLLVTSCKLGHNFHVFRLMAHPVSSSLGAVHHLYTLHRGETTAKVIDISFNHDSRWITVSSHRGTTHLFPITPYGGPVNIRTHCKPHVVNRASRFHRSAGLDEFDHAVGRRSPVLSTSPSSSGQYDRYPTLIQQNTLNNNMGNPRLPPYPHPITIYPAFQVKQPLNVVLNPGNKNQSPSHSPTGFDNVYCVCAKFCTPRLCVIGSPKLDVERRDAAKRPVDSLFVMAQSGTLVEYVLEPRAKSVVDKVTDDCLLELNVVGRMQWNLQRLKNSQELRPPLPSNSPLILAHEAVTSQIPTAPDLYDLPGLTRQDSKDSLSSDHSSKDESDEQWLPQVEIITHAGPHRRLWMGPQFSFKTYQENTTVLSSNSSSLLSQSPESNMAAMDMLGDEGDLESLKLQPTRSNPVSMPNARPAYRRLSGSDSPSTVQGIGAQNVPLLIEAGSFDQSPHLLDVYSNWTESSVAKQPRGSEDLEEDQLKETLADAMVESPCKDLEKLSLRHHDIPRPSVKTENGRSRMGRNAATGNSDKVEVVHSREEVDHSREEVDPSGMEVDQRVNVDNVSVKVECIKTESDNSSVEVVHNISEVQQVKSKIDQNQGGYSEKDLVKEEKDKSNSGKLSKHDNAEYLMMESAKESTCDEVKRAPNKAVETVADTISKNGKKKGNSRKSVEKQSTKDAANTKAALKIAPSSKTKAKTKTQSHNDATSVSSVISNKTSKQNSAKEKDKLLVKLKAKPNTKVDNNCAVDKHRKHISGATAKEYIDTAIVEDSEIVENIIVDCHATSKLEIDMKSQLELEEETRGKSRSDQKPVIEIIPKIKVARASSDKSNEKRWSVLKKESCGDKEKVFESTRQIKEVSNKKNEKQPENGLTETVMDKSKVMSSKGKKNDTCDQVVAVNRSQNPREGESSHEMKNKSHNNPEHTEEIVQESIDSSANLQAKAKPAQSSYIAWKLDNENVKSDLKEAELKIVSIPSENIKYDITNKCSDARHGEYDIETVERIDIHVATSRTEIINKLEKAEIREPKISVMDEMSDSKVSELKFDHFQGEKLDAVKWMGFVSNDGESENKVIDRPRNELEDHIDKHSSKSHVKSNGQFEVKSKKKRKKKKSDMEDSVYVETPEKSLSPDTESKISGKILDEGSILSSKENDIRSVSEMPTTPELLTNKPNISEYIQNRLIVSRLVDAKVELSDKPANTENAVTEPISEVESSGLDNKKTSGYMTKTLTSVISNKHISEGAAETPDSVIENKLSGNTAKYPVLSIENNTYRDIYIPSASGIDNKHTFADKAKHSACDVENKTSEDEVIPSASGVENQVNEDVPTALVSTVHLKKLSVTKEKASVNDIDNKKTSGKSLNSEIEKEKIEMQLPTLLKDGEKNILRRQESGELPEEEMFVVSKKKNRKKKNNEEAKVESSRSSSETEIVEEKTTPNRRSICKEIIDNKDYMSKNELLTMEKSGMKDMYERNVRSHESRQVSNIDCDKNDIFGNGIVVKTKDENVFIDIGPETQALEKDDDDDEIVIISEEKRMEDSAGSGSKYETAESAEDDPATWERSEFEERMEDNETEDDTATISSSNVSCDKRSYELDFAESIIDTSDAVKSSESAVEKDKEVCTDEDKNDTSETGRDPDETNTDKTVKEDGIACKKEVVVGTKVDMGASLLGLSMYDDSAGSSSRSSEERDGTVADNSIAGKSENKSKKKKRKNKKKLS